MSNTIVTHVYKWIIENVVENVKKDFSSMGVEESILQEFQRNWETKVINSKVANFQKFSVNEDYYAQPTYDQYPAATQDIMNRNNYQFPPFNDSQYSVPPAYPTVQTKVEPISNPINSQSSNIPQTDGADDELTTEEIDKIIEKKILEANDEKEKGKGKEISQVDGEDDEDDDDLNYDDNINSDLDDDDDDDDDNDENEPEHLILCQYEKVNIS
ncbi:hypothetical protein PIROE2DRAFT_2453 [Piromyces sp. E2]|nr:hypothetical protein PIROE2DRAFT_2453 [Piromyces sp. E2]|eukprot:OUM69587.1 hypothetical protein PIROE2DRAFT_2453 [Piromyces sp. E2]